MPGKDYAGCAETVVSFIILIVLAAIPIYGLFTIILAINASIQLGSYTVQTTCTIEEKHLDRIDSLTDSEVYEFRARFTYLVKISADKTQRVQGYDVGSQMWDSRDHAQAVLDRFQIGHDYACWYDPNDPSRAILTREYNFAPALIFGALLALEVGIVLYGFKHWT